MGQKMAQTQRASQLGHAEQVDDSNNQLLQESEEL